MPLFDSLSIAEEDWKLKWGSKEVDLKNRSRIVKFTRRKGNLETNLAILDEWGLSKDGQKKMVLQTFSMVRLRSQVVLAKLEWLVQEFGFTKADAAAVVAGYPSYLQYSIGKSIAPFLCLFKREGISNETIRKMIRKYPRILGQYGKYRRIAGLMEEHLDMPEVEVINLVASFPKIFTYSFERNILPMVHNYLGVGLTKEEVKNLMDVCPSFLAGRDFDKLITSKLAWLQGELGLTKDESLKVLKEHPMTFFATIECWQECGEFFVSIGIEKSDLKKFFECNYSLLGRREAGLREKFEFARSTLMKQKSEVLACPDFFAIPFENALLLRVAYLRQQNVDATSLEIPEYCGMDSQVFFAKHGNPDDFLGIREKWDACSKKEKLKYAFHGLQHL